GLAVFAACFDLEGEGLAYIAGIDATLDGDLVTAYAFVAQDGFEARLHLREDSVHVRTVRFAGVAKIGADDFVLEVSRQQTERGVESGRRWNDHPPHAKPSRDGDRMHRSGASGSHQHVIAGIDALL